MFIGEGVNSKDLRPGLNVIGEKRSTRGKSRLGGSILRLKCGVTCAKKQDFVFLRNGRVHLNRRGHRFS